MVALVTAWKIRCLPQHKLLSFSISARRLKLQTATLKEATTALGVTLDDMVRYQTLGNSAIIQIDLKPAHKGAAKGKLPAMPEETLTPEEEFRRKYPNIEIDSEFFKLVGCLADVPPGVSDKELILDAIASIYGEEGDEDSH